MYAKYLGAPVLYTVEGRQWPATITEVLDAESGRASLTLNPGPREPHCGIYVEGAWDGNHGDRTWDVLMTEGPTQ